MMPSCNESPLNLVRGPARKPGWAQLIRLGGDRVAILFGELRKSVGKIEGIVESLHYAAGEARWVVQYEVGSLPLFTVRIVPGLLEGCMPLSLSECETLLATHSLSKTIRSAIRSSASEARLNLVCLPLTDRRKVRSFANLVRAKNRLSASYCKRSL
jgi:hypothetical protein